jgi:hypothetical protein
MNQILPIKHWPIPVQFKIIGLVFGVLLQFASVNTILANETTTKVTVVGVLSPVVLIGGETTGWMMELTRKLQILGMPTFEIDVDPKGQTIDKFSEKLVKVTGHLRARSGKERGDYPVIELETIQLSESN